MPMQCPTCSRVNPTNATYCFYDGRALDKAGDQGPVVGLGTRPFSLPFSFSDGQGCANYNQLVLACDRHWNEARTNLLNGTWQTFFSTIGRADLAALAMRSAKETDPDVGLCRLLEGLPADAEALRPPKLALTSPVEDLGALEPGKDHKFQLVIENQGVLLLSGSVMTDCDWLFFGDRQGNSSAKLFQTRDAYTLSVRVGGDKLRAAKKPLDGQIVIDTNGGRQTVAVRATVPIRPFPAGQVPNNVLAGAKSPRELAIKAKEHPKEAAVLFEQGAVKAWYESNGWTYPIQGTQARGKGALQQFFEALGLTKPPHLDINTQRIDCRGEVGQRLGRDVVIRTEEARIVNAEAHSSEHWLKVLPAKSQGNSVTIPLRIEVPPRPGETLHAAVTFHGNGQQRFVVPVTLAVEGLTPAQEEKKASRSRRREWIAAGVGLCLFLAVGAAVAMVMSNRGSGEEDLPPGTQAGPPGQPAPPDQPVPKGKAWWDGIAGNNLAAPLAKLKQAAGANRPLFDSLEAESDDDRRKGYEQLEKKLPELWRTPAVRVPLGQFVTECCVYEPSELNLSELLRGLAGQFPPEDREFPAEDKGEGVERASFWLGAVCDAIAHKAARPDRSRDLASELSKILGFDPDAPPAELKDRAQKSLAELCYHNTLPTAEKSVEQALTIRKVLIDEFSRHLTPDFCDKDDVKLLAIGLAKGNNEWPKLKPIFESCAKSNDVRVGFKLIDLYAKANAELAPKMEEVLAAARWKAAGNAKLSQAAKAEAIRSSMAANAKAAKISPEQRAKQLQELLAKSPGASGKPAGQQQTASLQDTVQMAHASTMACILFSKDPEVSRFDELIARIPTLEQGKPADEEKKPEVKPRRPEGIEVIEVDAGAKQVQGELTKTSERDPRRGAYRTVYSVPMKAQGIYYIDMRSPAFRPYIRLESAAGQQLDVSQGANAQIIFVPTADGDYRLVASCSDRKAVGRFTLQISLQQQVFQFPGRRFPIKGMRPGLFPGQGPMPGKVPMKDPGPGAAERKTPEVNESDLTHLADKQSDVRIEAFKNLARNVSDDLPYRSAKRMAYYLLLSEWGDAEQNAAMDALKSLTNCRHLLQAVADFIAMTEKPLAPQRTVAAVGALLGQPELLFKSDADWRAGCRQLLLQRALELTKPAAAAANDADRAADLLRDLYKEQGLALGLDAPDFESQTQLAPVLERLVMHVAAKAADKTSLEQIGRQLKAAKFAAANDMEHVVLLQRLWVKVLTLDLQGRAKDGKPLLEIPQELEKKDGKSSNLLDQLWFGEETALQAWAQAHNLKLK